jgi:hypothetical protein
MRVRMIWQATTGVDFDTVRESFESQFRVALRSLAFALDGAGQTSWDPEGVFAKIRKYARPVYATSDWPERPDVIRDHPFLRINNRHFVIDLTDAGRIEVRGIGNRANLEVYTHGTGATQHLLPIVALIKLHLEIIERDIELRFGGSQSNLPTQWTAAVGLDVAVSSGQVLGMAVFEAMISELDHIEKSKDYIGYMESKGIDRIVKKSLDLLEVEAPSMSKSRIMPLLSWLVRVLGIFGLVLSVLWFISSPGFEPLITLVASLAAIIGSTLGK